MRWRETERLTLEAETLEDLRETEAAEAMEAGSGGASDVDARDPAGMSSDVDFRSIPAFPSCTHSSPHSTPPCPAPITSPPDFCWRREAGGGRGRVRGQLKCLLRRLGWDWDRDLGGEGGAKSRAALRLRLPRPLPSPTSPRLLPRAALSPFAYTQSNGQTGTAPPHGLPPKNAPPRVCFTFLAPNDIRGQGTHIQSVFTS